MIKRLLKYACLFLCASVLTAQANQEEAVSVDFRIYYWPEQTPIAFPGQEPLHIRPSSQPQSQQNASAEIPEDEQFDAPELYFANGQGEGEAVPLQLNEGQLSALYHYHGPPQIVFFEEAHSSEDTQLRIPKATTTLPSVSASYIFILYPKSDGDYAIFHISSEKLLRGKDNVMAINLTASPLECALGDVQFSLPVRGHAVLDAQSKSGVYYQALLVASPDTEGNIRKRLAQMITVTGQQKWILMLYNRVGNSGGISLQKIDAQLTQSAKPTNTAEQL